MRSAASVLVLVLGAVALAGCDSSRPPGATVTNGTDTVSMSALSWCWGGLCVDGVPQYDATPMHAAPGQELRFRSGAVGSSTELDAEWRLADAPTSRGALDRSAAARR